MGAIQGKLIGIKLDDVYYRCQTALTLNINTNTSTEDACKPDPTVAGGGTNWDEPTVDSMSWDASFSARSFADSVDGNQATIIKKLIAGTNKVEVDIEYATLSSEFDGTVNQIFSGTGIISSFTLNADGTGSSTYDTSIQGVGAPIYTEVPVTT